MYVYVHGAEQHYTYICVVLSLIVKGETLCSPFAFVIAAALAYWVHIAPILFCLGMFQGITIYLYRPV